MKESEKLTVYVGTFITVMVGYIVTIFVAGFFTDLVSGIVIFPEWAVEEFALIDYLTPPRLTWLVYSVGWFTVCLLVNSRSTKWFEEEKRVGILSSFFFIIWFFNTLVIITGFLINSVIVSTLSLEALLDLLFLAPFWALAPSIAGLLGVNDITS